MAMVWFKLWGAKDFVESPLPHLTVMCFLVGCLSILMGLLAEMTMRTYYETSKTATYLVRDICSEKAWRARCKPGLRQRLVLPDLPSLNLSRSSSVPASARR